MNVQVGIAVFLLMEAATFGQSMCESLAGLALPDTAIAVAKNIAAGAFVPPTGSAAPFANLPAFCQVAGTITPTGDSSIKFELWLPVSGWNGKFMGIGGQGLSGGILYTTGPLGGIAISLASALAQGYATGGTDGGHNGPDSGNATWAIGHPEKVIDHGYRAVHEMTVRAKAIINTFYGTGPQHSYWNGCSEGGRQGLAEAQRYPADYDGILIGAPANYFTHLMAVGMWVSHAVHLDPDSFVPNPMAPVLSAAVLAACDVLDGAADGVIEDPRRCQFDVAKLQCSASNTSNCLTAAQVDGIKKIYAGPRNPLTGERIFPGMMPGSEPYWPGWSTGTNQNFGLFSILNPAWRDIVFEDPTWDWKTFELDRDVKIADAKVAHALNQTNPDLRVFRSLGGKVIHYHGWSDPAITPLNSINYYDSLVAAMGSLLEMDQSAALADTQNYYRVFLAPGWGHCGIGSPNVPGMTTFDGVEALDKWVTEGIAPDQIVLSRSTVSGAVDRTHPLCAYPKVAQWKGSGSVNEAGSFVCAETR